MTRCVFSHQYLYCGKTCLLSLRIVIADRAITAPLKRVGKEQQKVRHQNLIKEETSGYGNGNQKSSL